LGASLARVALLWRQYSKAETSTVGKLLDRFAANESAATAIEYALLALLIAIPLILSLTAIGSGLSGRFNEVSSNFS
jgi:pilus assembly protein Flp/PilA